MANEQHFRLGLSRLEITLAEPALIRCLRYCDELLKWNRRVNLVARQTTVDEAIEKHFLDSLSLLPFIIKHFGDGTINLLDVGSGAGFPGLVLAAVRPTSQFTLVEPRQKRVHFLRHIVRTLGLNNVTLCDDRLAALSFPATTHFDLITGRAVAEPVAFLGMVAPFVESDSRVLLMQGKEPLDSWYGIVKEQFTLIDSSTFLLPFSGAERSLYLLCRNH